MRCENRPDAIVDCPVFFCIKKDGADVPLAAVTVDEVTAEVVERGRWETATVSILRLADREVVADVFQT